MNPARTIEEQRLAEDGRREKNWKRWGRTFRNGNGARSVKTTPKGQLLGLFPA